ncbi:MAG: fibronectin type III domain-containing protein [Bacteroidia bacterium]|nr:fibronectin type III domain-containing protein [Bacteroidia bacterium]MDW8332645.1 fibronectin type III domain-containing protein [Bacteroidia bacterium]
MIFLLWAAFCAVERLEAQLCSPPNPVTIVNLLPGSVELAWNPVSGADFYEIEIRTSDGNPVWVEETNQGTMTVSGLVPQTDYVGLARSFCGPDISPYYQFSFTTPPSGCPAPTGAAALNVTHNSALAVWDEIVGAIYYRIEIYRSTGEQIGGAEVVQPFYSISGLTQGREYYFVVRVVCSDGSPSPFAAPVHFVTQTLCSTVTGVQITDLSFTSASFSWNPAAPNPTGYQFRWRPLGASNFFFLNTAQPSITLNGLNPNTKYEFTIRATCSGMYFSELTPIDLFQTLATEHVWPGDADNDGDVDATDFFVVASGYGLSGMARYPEDQSVVWAEWPARDNWPASVVVRNLSFNRKYSDANGDGTVDLFDLAVTLLNRGRTR